MLEAISGTNRGFFHSQNRNYPEEGLIFFFILCIFTQGNRCLVVYSRTGSVLQRTRVGSLTAHSFYSHLFKGCLRNILDSLEKLGVGICLYPGLTGPFGLAPSGHGGGILRKVMLQCMVLFMYFSQISHNLTHMPVFQYSLFSKLYSI